MAKTEQIWNTATPLAATEGAVSVDVELGDTVGALRITGSPVSMAANYNVVVELQPDNGPWEPETRNDTEHASAASSGSQNVACARVVHTLDKVLTLGFTVSCFGFKKAHIKVWGGAGDTVIINATKLNRSPT